MIKAAIRQQFQKMVGVMALVTFCLRLLVKFRFTDCPHVVMAIAAIAKNFLVINEGGDSKTLRSMTGLAHITGSQMVGVFRVDKIAITHFVDTIVTIHTIG